MISRDYKLVDPAGMHARPAAVISKIAASYEDVIKIVFGEKEGNLKSIMSILSLAIPADSAFSIEVSGSGAEELMAQLHSSIVENNIAI